jgi:hypothetical protein
MGLVRAGAKRLHGHRFPPEGLGLDATGAAGPSKKNERSQPEAVIGSSREGSSPDGEDALPSDNQQGGFVRPPTIERAMPVRGAE